MPQQEGFEAQCGGLEVTERLFPCAAEVTDRLIFHGGDRDGSEIARAHQPGQWHRIAAVGFDPIPRLFGNEGGSHNPTVVPFFVEIALEPGATRAGCIDKDEAFGLRLELTDTLINVGVSCTDRPIGDDVGLMVFGDLGHGKRVFMDIQTNRECARL
jgi:hypothetical protein